MDVSNEVISKTELDKAKEHLGHAKLLWFVHKIQSYGFWAMIILGTGIALGITYADRESVKNVNAQIQVGSFLHRGIVYDITARAIQPVPPPSASEESLAPHKPAATAVKK